LGFFLVSDDAYLNLSLHLSVWNMVIVDMPYFDVDDSMDSLYDHVENGGRFLMSGYQVDSNPTNPLWALLGFQFIHESYEIVPMYIWSPNFPIFQTPYDYSAANFTPTHDYGDEGDILGVFSNATAICGNSTSYDVNHTMMVVGNSARTLYNGYLIDEFWGDTDDSAYPDNFELWVNQIAFIMRPEIDSPADKQSEYGEIGDTIVWTPSSEKPSSYKIRRNSVDIVNTNWDGGPITVILDGYGLGDYIFTVTVYDTSGVGVADMATVSVVDTTDPAWLDAPDNLMYEEGTAEHLLNWSFAELLPDSWVLYINGTEYDNGTWDGSEISADAGGLTEGIYNATMTVNDTSGNLAASWVILTVTAAPTTTTTTTTSTTTTTTSTTEPTNTGTTTPPPGDNTILIIIIAAIAGVVVIIIIIMMKKKS
ncbi:MAG: hypothetical protein P1Q69_20945, partial [Candidatus Thorarchaeota archaeon]|nr:hypothetical protein [Candidatus Thorarchaeota archaeon]